jgi:hypothetical protein
MILPGLNNLLLHPGAVRYVLFSEIFPEQEKKASEFNTFNKI